MLGWLWSGSKGTYPIKPITADTREELIRKAETALADGTLNSGDFESLIGATLFIKATEFIDIDGKTYHRDMNDPGAYIGDMTEDDQQALEQAYLNRCG